MRDARWKLIRFYELGEWELYDLQADPHELHNLAGRPAYAVEQERLRVELERLRAQYDLP